MDSTNGITPVMPIGGNGGWGDGNAFLWIFALLILAGGGLGGGLFGGGAQQYATRDQVQSGFDTQNLQSQTRDILSAVNAGTAQSVAATNATFHDSLAAMQSLYNETARDVAALAVGQANALANQNECCGSTKMMIADAGATLSAQIANNKYESALQMAGMEQRIMAKMDATEITALRDKVQRLELQNATQNVLRYPNQWTYTGGFFPPMQCGCGNV